MSDSAADTLTDSKTQLAGSFEALRVGDFETAQSIFGAILKSDYSNSVAESGMRFCKHWSGRFVKIVQVNNDLDKAKKLIDEWMEYLKFTEKHKGIHSRVKSCGLYLVFNTALKCLLRYQKDNRTNDNHLVFLTAVCYKMIGDYEKAINGFEQCLEHSKNDANSMAQLADCYASVDEEKKSKLLFREAFFIDPQTINLDIIESAIVSATIEKTKEHNEPLAALRYMIPVYGRIYNILNVCRDMLSIEIGRLEKEIFAAEKIVLAQSVNKNPQLTARLLNCYFWMYDYLMIRNNDKYKILEIESSIKSVNEKIFDLFIKNRG